MKPPNTKTAALKKLKKQFFNASWVIDKFYWKRVLLYAEYYNLEDFYNTAEEVKNELNKKYDILSKEINKIDKELRPHYNTLFKIREQLEKLLKENP
jgi:predicted  nucleic acid-binding Zn-ribbon protein